MFSNFSIGYCFPADNYWLLEWQIHFFTVSPLVEVTYVPCLQEPDSPKSTAAPITMPVFNSAAAPTQPYMAGDAMYVGTSQYPGQQPHSHSQPQYPGQQPQYSPPALSPKQQVTALCCYYGTTLCWSRIFGIVFSLMMRTQFRFVMTKKLLYWLMLIYYHVHNIYSRLTHVNGVCVWFFVWFL